MIMKGFVQWNPIYSVKDFRLQRESGPGHNLSILYLYIKQNHQRTITEEPHWDGQK